jgi:hypothetical protein
VKQIEGEVLMLVPQSFVGFRAAIGALRSLGDGTGKGVYTFPHTEDRRVLLLLKKLRKPMGNGDIKEELGELHLNVQAVFQLQSNDQNQTQRKQSLTHTLWDSWS